MRRITIWILSTVTALVLLASYRTSTMGAGSTATADAAVHDSAASGATDPGASEDSASPDDAPSSDSGTTDSADTADTATTYDGSVAQTRWGPVQVSITVTAAEIVDVEILQVPNSNHRDVEINNHAVPILIEETLGAQSADIDTVSGATVTSDGYRESLQAAIDEAHLG